MQLIKSFFDFIAKDDLASTGRVLQCISGFIEPDVVLAFKKSKVLIENISKHLSDLVLSKNVRARNRFLDKENHQHCYQIA